MKCYNYTNKNGRVRTVIKHDNGKITSKSYPRILMEEKLGRPLKPYEDVHHIDGNISNNSLHNLTLINHGEHQLLHNPPKFVDKIVNCQVCNKQFVWTAKRQSLYFRDIRRGRNRIITCSKSCSSYYGRQEQLKRNFKAECELNGESFPNGNTVPNTINK